MKTPFLKEFQQIDIDYVMKNATVCNYFGAQSIHTAALVAQVVSRRGAGGLGFDSQRLPSLGLVGPTCVHQERGWAPA